MRLLFFTDLHLAERPPLSRSQSYCDELFAKLEEIRGLAGACDMTVFGGDLFHPLRPQDTSHRLVRRVIECLREWPTHCAVVAGNHCQPQEGLEGLNRMPLGVVLEALKENSMPVELLGETVVGHGQLRVQLTARHWSHHLDKLPELYAIERHPAADFAVLVSHGMVMPEGEGWPFPAVGMDQIVTDADVVLLGHMHWRTGVHRVNGTLFVGPGAVARTSRTESELKRRPAVLVVTLERGREPVFDMIELRSARPAEEVFVWSDPSNALDGSEMFAGYVAALEAGLDVEGLSVEEALAGLEGQARAEVVAKVREYLGRAGL